MDKLYKLLAKDNQSQEEMIYIANCYLEGTILKDIVAAEAWLQKCVEVAETKETVIAMELLRTKVWKKKSILTNAERKLIQEEIEEMRKLGRSERVEYLTELLKTGETEIEADNKSSNC